jgi:hypothetical protein
LEIDIAALYLDANIIPFPYHTDIKKGWEEESLLILTPGRQTDGCFRKV